MPRSDDRIGLSSRVLGGLRSRVLISLVLVSAVALAVAALALLPPLRSRLRHNAITAAEAALAEAKPGLGGIPWITNGPIATELKAQVFLLRHNGGGERVAVYTSSLRKLADTDPGLLDTRDVRSLALAAIRDHGNKHVRAHIYGGLLVVASTYEDWDHRLALVLAQKLDYVDQATDVVGTAFLEAAAAGLIAALVVGVAVSSRLVRRLRRLRDATIGLDEEGLYALGRRYDDGRDEIGEVALAFAAMGERLRRQEDARRAFVATASHELRTPLTSLDGMLELLAEDLDSEPIDLEDARERVARAHQQTRRLASLASDLLDLSRLDAAVELRSEPVELGEIARAVSAEFERRASERGIVLAIDGAQARAWARGDPAGVARIVRILLDNSLRIAPRETTVMIAVASAGEHATVEVSDSGPGVAAEERERIFERFQRGSTHNGEAGFGLGLAIGRELAQRMGGSLDVVNRPPGATFRLELEVAQFGAPLA